MDEGVSESLPTLQSTSNAGGHAEDDERYTACLSHSLEQTEQILHRY